MIKIGTLEIQDIAGHDIKNTIGKLDAGREILRSKNGTGILASRWEKASVSISGSGWIPDGLDGIDEDDVHDIHCIHWLSAASTSNVITIPRTFRTDDYAPQGIAIVNGNAVETTVALAGNVATLGTVTGATQYQISYCPVITSIIRRINRDYDQQSHTWSWSIEAEEQ